MDIVFATFGDKGYAAAQRARRKQLMDELTVHERFTESDLKREWTFEDFTPQDLPTQAIRLAEVALKDQLVLFIGAGSSVGAGVPAWKQLLRDIARDARVEDAYVDLLEDRDLRDWATLIDRKVGHGRDIRAIAARKIQEKQRYSLQHALLASLPSKEAVTTNFDQLFELASRVGDRDLSVLPAHPSSSPAAWLLKLHGSVDNPARMVLTRSDYLNMPRNRGALMGLVQGLLLTRHMLYVGYSLSDEDFHELIHEVRAALSDSADRRATMITLATDLTQHDLWSDELNIVAMGLSPNAKPEKFQEAGRQVDIFLDLLGFLSTTSAPFFSRP